jgi:hypothetical protein
VHVAPKWSGIFVVNKTGCVAITGCLGINSNLLEFFLGDAEKRRVYVVFREKAVWTTFEGGLKLVDNSFCQIIPMRDGLHR